MPSFKDRLNPQILEFVAKVRSGEYQRLIKARLGSYKWFFLGALVLILLLLSIAIGRRISRRQTDVYIPPIVELPTPTQENQKTSVFSSLKRSLVDFNISLPDPAIPTFDNNINLEANNL